MSEWHQRFANYYEDVLRASSQSSGRTLTRASKLLDRHLACDLAILDVTLPDSLEKNSVVLHLEAPGADELRVESDSLDDVLKETPHDNLQLELSGPLPEDVNVHRGERILAVRAGRKIQRSQARDPYNRETTLGGPIVSIRKGDGRISGPLLYWEVDLTYNPGLKRLVVAKRSSVPELNVMLLEGFLEQRGDIETLTAEMQEVVLSGPPSLAIVRKLLRVISGLVDGWEQPTLVEEPRTPLRSWLRATVQSPAVSFRSVLFNTPRSNAALLQDLRKIAQLGSASAGSPLDILTNPDDPTRDPRPRESRLSFSDTVDGGNPLWFPFESNPSQRRIGRLAERARILTVQGPPGTGKSQTIANLVCHLVAEGKSVLVTSHQRKAVEVVAGLLKPLPDLALPLIKGDRESSQRLQARIQRFLEDHTLSVEHAKNEVQRGLEALHELDRNLRILAHRFQELSRKEHEQWERFQPYAELREWDRLHPADQPPSEQSDKIGRALPEWCRLTLELGPSADELRSTLCPQGPSTPGATESRILRDLESLKELGAGLLTAPTEEEVRAARIVFESRTSEQAFARQLVDEFLEWIRAEGWDFLSAVERAENSIDSEHVLSSWIDAGRRTPTDALARIQKKVAAIVRTTEEQDVPAGKMPTVSDPDDADDLAHATGVLRRIGGGFFSWYLRPSVRRARQRISAFLDRPLVRERCESVVSRLDTALRWYRNEQHLLELGREITFHAPDSIAEFSPPECGLKHRLDWLALSRKVQATVTLLQLAPRVPKSILCEMLQAVGFTSGRYLDRAVLRHLERIVQGVAEEFRRREWLEDVEKGTPLSNEWLERFSPLIRDLKAGEMSDEGRAVYEWLEDRTVAMRDLLRMRELERGELVSLPETLGQLSEELNENPKVPEWIEEHIEEALKAHRLSRLLQQNLDADPDDISSVAGALRKGEQKRRRILFELVRRRHRMHQARVLQEGNVNAELQRVRQLLGGPDRMKRSLIALRESIEYRTVLKAFPAWICTIDDAARLFPPQQELFDYVIVDEASQCAQPALLPLALRCRHLIVVGDEKQLRPSFGRFIPSAQLEALRTTHGLDQHRAGLFARGDDSLLDLANFRANASGFLDEHFRCDPAIIAWSNKRFYDHKLKILTHRRPRSFKPALSVVRLEDADDDPDKKQNMQEAKAIVREVRRRTDDPSNDKLSIGIISPFRRQADLIQDLLETEFERDPETLERHQIIASTADGFQGDERDIILYSFRVGPSTHRNSLGVLERHEERFNVAFSRARRLGISFLSCSPTRLPNSGVTRSWIGHSQGVMNGEVHFGGSGRPDHFDSKFEQRVCDRLRERGLHVVTQEPCGPFRIDLVVSDAADRKLAVECDGEWKSDEFGHLRPEDYHRQDLIERAGWVVHRISGRRYLLDPVREIEAVVEALERQPTAEDLAILSGETALPDVLDDSDGEAPPESQPVIAERDPEPSLASPQTEREEAEPDDLGEGDLTGRERQVLVRLVRWSLQGSQVKGSMFDRLIAIDERLQQGGKLTEEDERALDFIRRLAESQGFDPNEEIDL